MNIAIILLTIAVLSTVPIIVRETKKAREDRLNEKADGDCFPAPFVSAKWGRR